MKVCPSCKKGYPDFQPRCDCGVALTQKHIKRTPSERDSQRQARVANIAGYAPLAIFALLTLILVLVVWSTYFS